MVKEPSMTIPHGEEALQNRPYICFVLASHVNWRFRGEVSCRLHVCAVNLLAFRRGEILFMVDDWDLLPTTYMTHLTNWTVPYLC